MMSNPNAIRTFTLYATVGLFSALVISCGPTHHSANNKVAPTEKEVNGTDVTPTDANKETSNTSRGRVVLETNTLKLAPTGQGQFQLSGDIKLNSTEYSFNPSQPGLNPTDDQVFLLSGVTGSEPAPIGTMASKHIPASDSDKQSAFVSAACMSVTDSNRDLATPNVDESCAFLFIEAIALNDFQYFGSRSELYAVGATGELEKLEDRVARFATAAEAKEVTPESGSESDSVSVTQDL